MYLLINSKLLLKKMKKYIFFIRHHNDWDNIAPIIYFLGKKTQSNIYVCFYRTDLRHTELFIYLEKELKERIKFYFWKNSKINIFVNFLKLLINKLISKLKLDLQIEQNIYASEKTLINWLKNMELKNSEKIVVVFDRTLNAFVKKVKNHLKNKNTIFISCPHGSMTNVNRMMYTHEIKREDQNFRLRHLKEFDFMIFTDYLEFEYNRKYGLQNKQNSINKNKLKVLGSLRYSPEWLEHVDKFSHSIIDKKNRIKAVFFMKKFVHNVFVDEVLRTFEIFASYPNIDFYIVPHTRGMKFSMKKNYSNIYINQNLSSASLIKMADVIFFYGGTSIVIEPLVRKKLLACIDYLDCNVNIFDKYKACHVLRCRDDLYYFLDTFMENKAEILNGNELVNELVHGRDATKPVNEKYVEFFKNV